MTGRKTQDPVLNDRPLTKKEEEELDDESDEGSLPSSINSKHSSKAKDVVQELYVNKIFYLEGKLKIANQENLALKEELQVAKVMKDSLVTENKRLVSENKHLLSLNIRLQEQLLMPSCKLTPIVVQTNYVLYSSLAPYSEMISNL